MSTSRSTSAKDDQDPFPFLDYRRLTFVRTDLPGHDAVSFVATYELFPGVTQTPKFSLTITPEQRLTPASEATLLRRLDQLRVGFGLITPLPGDLPQTKVATTTSTDSLGGDDAPSERFTCRAALMSPGAYADTPLKGIVGTLNVRIDDGQVHVWDSFTGGVQTFHVHVDFGAVEVIPPNTLVGPGGNSMNTGAVTVLVIGRQTPSRYDFLGSFDY